MSWIERGLCRSRPDIDWVPPADAPGGLTREKLANLREAKAVCAVCPVKDECLADALAHWGTAGIWGGTSENQRSKMHRDRKVRSVAVCGTDAGYYRHLRQEQTEPCAECRRAHALAQKQRKLRVS